jgi:hypothetical protein
MNKEINISHKNQEISILTIKKKQSKVKTSSSSHKTSREGKKSKPKTEECCEQQ